MTKKAWTKLKTKLGKIEIFCLHRGDGFPIFRHPRTDLGSIVANSVCGAIAQLGERLNGIQEVGGSTPPGSTKQNNALAGKPAKAFLFKWHLASQTFTA